MADYLYLDFETEYDPALEARWGLDPVLEYGALLKPDELLKKTVPDIKAYISPRKLVIPAQWINEVRSTEVSGKNRSGVLDVVWDVVGAREDYISKFALDPELCTVVLAGFAQDDGVIHTVLGRHGNEKNVLGVVWSAIRTSMTIVGFNIFSFDIKVLLSRSAYYGIKPSVPGIDLNPWQSPWRDPQILDLMVARFGRDKAKKLKVWARDLGLEPLSGDLDGSMVAQLTDEELHQYGESDIDITRAIHLKLGNYYWPAPNFDDGELPF